MDAIDILGGLLGGKSGSGGIGGKILKEILGGGGGGGGSNAPSRTQQTQSQPGSRGHTTDVNRSSSELEDLLNVATQRSANRPSQTAPTTKNYQQPAPNYQQPAPQFPQSRSQPVPQTKPKNKPSIFPEATEVPIEERQNAMALVLIRAMIHASKADGQVSEEEQQKIFTQLGDTSEDAIQFLRAEFAKAGDVKEFAWSVPLGLEQQVYTMSLLTLDLDNNKEAEYLQDLAHGLRLAPNLCNQIHQRNNAPVIFE